MVNKTNDLKTLYEAIVGREIPMEMEFDPKDICDQYAHNPYVDPKVKLYGMPNGKVSDTEVYDEAGN